MRLSKEEKRSLQLKILEIIKYIDAFCNENNIEYYIIYGSCLGAVRHKGFIPWDDDMDIAMTEDNYFKFIKAFEQSGNKEKYYLQRPGKEKDYYLSFSKLRDITTTLVEENNKDKNITYGVYIDIFPLIGVPKNKIKRNILKINRAFLLSANINVINNKFLKSISKIIIKLIGKERVIKYCQKNCFKYKTKDYDEWLSLCDGDGFNLNLNMKEVYGKPLYVEFENTMLPIPRKYDEYLTHIYGDYMKIPSEKDIEKKEHTPYYMNLNLPYKEYIKLKKSKKDMENIYNDKN
jgi:lipopolysaccharide cholinephosphotransferase